MQEIKGTITVPREELERWEERYKTGDTPWDSGEVCSILKGYYLSIEPPPKKVLELGCGTGTNAIWLAEQGAEVTAFDLSAEAVKLARERTPRGLDIRWFQGDALGELPINPGNFDFAFDRGVFHAVSSESRGTFVEKVFSLLGDGGYWLSLVGNAEEENPPHGGPPRLRASEFIPVVEPYFQILELKAVKFEGKRGELLFWAGFYRKRPTNI